MQKLTKRHEEVLINIFLKDQQADGERTRDQYRSYEKRHGEPVPVWGRPEPHQRAGRAGGSRYRMIERIAEAGFLPMVTTRHGRSYPKTGSLTSKALGYLKDRFPAIPGIDEAIATAQALELEEAAKEVKESDEREAARLERVAIRKAERRERMAAVLQDFQVRHDLTGDQLEEMWLRIVEEEHSI